MFARLLILFVVVAVLMFGGATLLDRFGYSDSPLRFVWYACVGGLTAVLYVRLVGRRR